MAVTAKAVGHGACVLHRFVFLFLSLNWMIQTLGELIVYMFISFAFSRCVHEPRVVEREIRVILL